MHKAHIVPTTNPLTDIERTRATIARLQQKVASAEGASARYYELCLIGWRAWLRKLESGVALRRIWRCVAG